MVHHEVSIRPCVPGDEEALALVGRATFLETFAGILDGADIVAHCARSHAVETYRDWLARADCRLWLAEAPHGAPVGFIVLAPAQLPLDDLAENDVEIKRIYLLSRFHGGGLGKHMAQQAIDAARERGARRVLLGVYARNEAAIGFYARMGFRKVGTRTFNVGHRFYDDDIMGLTL